jgi:glycosyltransferase involved in cell wall biosynthesis
MGDLVEVATPHERPRVKARFTAHVVRMLPELVLSRPRILPTLECLEVAGSQRLVVDLVERLNPWYEQSVLVGRVVAPMAFENLPVLLSSAADGAARVRQCVQLFRPDLVHVHHWGDAWSKMVLQTCDDLGCRIVQNIDSQTNPFASTCTETNVFVSQSVMQECEVQSVQPPRVCIYPGSDLETFNQEPDAAPDDCLGMVYRLAGDKINERAIDVFIKVALRRPQTRGLIVGSGVLLAPFRRRVQEAGCEERIAFTGLVAYEDLVDMYRRMSVFVAPIWNESFGQVTPFAMGMGLPVTAYDVGPMAEILGSREFLATPERSDELAELVVRLLNDRPLRLSIGAHNRERARKLFSLQTMVDSYRQLFATLLGVS